MYLMRSKQWWLGVPGLGCTLVRLLPSVGWALDVGWCHHRANDGLAR